MGTVISGAQSVDNNVVPVVSSGKNQSVNGQKFGDIMAKSVGGNQLIKLRQVILIRRRIQKQIIKWVKKLIKLPTKYMTR